MHLYKVKKQIGQGGFGTVSLAVHKQTGEKVAIKKFNDIDHFMKADSVKEIFREA